MNGTLPCRTDRVLWLGDWRLACCAVAILGLAACGRNNGTTAATMPVSDIFPNEEARRQFETITPLLESAPVKVNVHPASRGWMAGLLNYENESQNVRLSINKETGKVQYFACRLAQRPEQSNVTPDEAYVTVQQLLKGLEIPLDDGNGLELVFLQKPNRPIGSKQSNPALGSLFGNDDYHFSASWQYKGSWDHAAVMVYVSPYSGKVTKFLVQPFRKPASLEQKISAVEAFRIARDFAENEGIPYSEEYDAPRVMEIGPNRSPSPPQEPMASLQIINPGRFIGDGEQCESRLCWEIFLDPPVLESIVSVDAATGEVIRR